MFLLSEEVAKLSFLSVSAGDTDCGAECQVSQDYPGCLPRSPHSLHTGAPQAEMSHNNTPVCLQCVSSVSSVSTQEAIVSNCAAAVNICKAPGVPALATGHCVTTPG